MGELTDRTALARATDGVAIVCHLAAALTSRGHGDDDFFELNLRGTYGLLQAVRAHAPGLRRLVYVSSDAVYWSGLLTPADFLPVDETHPRRPGSVYGATKLGAEELCLTSSGPMASRSRSCGPRPRPMPRSCSSARDPSGGRLFVRGMIAFLERQPSLDEASRVMLDALHRIDDGRERVYVVEDPDGRASRSTLNDAREPPTACAASRRRMRPWAKRSNRTRPGYAERELAERLGDRLGLPVSTVRTPFARPDWIVSSEKACRMLGYAPRRTVFDMLDEALEAHASRAGLGGRSGS